MNRETSIAWAAGLFEGEGCITCTDKRSAVSMSVANTDYDVVYKFYCIVQRGKIYAHKRQRDNWKQLYQWRCQGDDVEYVFNLLAPHLCARRLARGKEVLLQRLTYRLNVTKPKPCKGCGVNIAAKYIAGARTIYCTDCRPRTHSGKIKAA